MGKELQGKEDLIKKLFDPKNYNTIVLKAGDNSLTPTSLIDLLTNSDHREVKIEVLKKIKNENALPLLLEAIKATNNLSHKAKMIAACWESGINCSDQLEFFTDLALDSHLEISLEAITVIDTMEGPFLKPVVERCINKVNESIQTPLHADLLYKLKQFISIE